jgi:hypothetical protein
MAFIVVFIVGRNGFYGEGDDGERCIMAMSIVLLMMAIGKVEISKIELKVWFKDLKARDKGNGLGLHLCCC